MTDPNQPPEPEPLPYMDAADTIGESVLRQLNQGNATPEIVPAALQLAQLETLERTADACERIADSLQLLTQLAHGLAYQAQQAQAAAEQGESAPPRAPTPPAPNPPEGGPSADDG